jgi:DNA repair exonuclease SbcCD nuclease subunit
MQSFLLLGDVHLGKGANLGKQLPGAQLNTRVVDQLDLLTWVLDRARILQVDSIIITGDIFEDPKPHPTLIAQFVSWLKDCEAEDIAVDIVCGNHDVLRTQDIYYSPLDIVKAMNLEHVYVHDTITTVNFANAGITFIPFRDRKSLGKETLQEAIEHIRSSLEWEHSSIQQGLRKYVIGHLALKGSLYVGDEVQDVSNELIVSLDMFEGYDLTVMGHVHKFQVLSDKCLHIGSMDISDFGEAEQDKYILIIRDDTPGYELERIPTRKLNEIQIKVPSGTADSTKYVLDKLAKVDLESSIARVRVEIEDEKTQSIDRKKIQEALLAAGTYNVHSVSETKQKKLVKRTEVMVDNQMDVGKALSLYADEKFKDDEEGKTSFLALGTDLLKEFSQCSR